jgi:hypothetical protein
MHALGRGLQALRQSAPLLAHQRDRGARGGVGHQRGEETPGGGGGCGDGGRRGHRFSIRPGPDDIPWFNGGLFAHIDLPRLQITDVTELRNAARLNWSAIDVSIFGILHSRFHELWSLRMGTSLEERPRYTPTTCFETFPFPAGLTPFDTAHQRTEPLASGALIPAGPDETYDSNQRPAQASRAL